jgi:N-acetylglucosaminyl-diphospho-decaprenol L-rhamnosyltransferase
MKDERVVVSVVSHPEGDLVAKLLDDLNRSCTTPLSVVVTINVPEVLSFSSSDFKFPLRLVHNSRPRGFGANHNAAFSGSNSPFFCVANPDVRLTSDPFPALM